MFWLWLPTHSPCGVPQARSRHRTYLSHPEMRATRHKTLPPCLTRCKSTFRSVLLSWNSHAVLISHTSRHEAMPPRLQFNKTFFNSVYFLGEVPLWNCSLVACSMMAPENFISHPTLYKFFCFLKGVFGDKKKIQKSNYVQIGYNTPYRAIQRYCFLGVPST